MEASDLLRQSARQAIDDGNLVLASEAYWGVAAHALQAVAERHGIPHSTNLDFRTIIEWLVSGARSDDVVEWYRKSYDLHRNFYQIVMTQDDVRDHSHYALRLADQIRPFA